MKILKISAIFVAVLFTSAAAYRSVVIAHLPEAERILPVAISKDEVPIPKRPGAKSIRIVGPPLKILKFQLDFKRNPLPLDWRFLERIDKRADVMVEGKIDGKGNFQITRMIDRGHPKAGQHIRSVLRSWKFVQYKRGTIKYYFNVPTRVEEMKVQIDISGLVRNYQFIEDNDYLKDGLLYYIEGLGRKNVTVINRR